jgi:hypothetical protein
MTHVFRHPKFLKELRKLRNNLDQAISGKNSTECKTRSPGPGLKPQATSSTESQAASSKRQAPSTLEQGSSRKHQAP